MYKYSHLGFIYSQEKWEMATICILAMADENSMQKIF